MAVKLLKEDSDIINVGKIQLPTDTSKYKYGTSYDEIQKDANTELINRKLKSGDMTLRDYAETLGNGYIDMDVYDDDIDAGVAFVWDSDMENGDNYDKFITLLANNVKIKQALSGGFYGDRLICGFSDFAKQHADKVSELLKNGYNQSQFEFDFDEEPEYCFAELIEDLIAGYAGEKTYGKWIEALS